MLKEGLSLGADYVTLYDHPDKYDVSMYNQSSMLLLSPSSHWKITPSTTDTFAQKEVLLRDMDILKKYSTGTRISRDHERFLHLGSLGRKLISSIPGFSNHTVVGYESPTINWEDVLENGKICFTTSLYSSGNNFDTPGKFNRNPQYDYFLFTNIKGLQCDWDVINTENIKEISDTSCNIRKSRYGKFLSWDIFQQIGKNYDYIVYCDAYITPKLIDWDSYLRKINDLDFAFMQRDHPDGNVRAGGIAQESQLIVNNGKDSYQSMSKTLSFSKHISECATSVPSIL